MTAPSRPAAIAVVGSINMDVAVYLERLPRPGETLKGSDYALGLGGKGANQAVAGARLGHEVVFLARLGRDDFGRAAETALKALGVQVSDLVHDERRQTGIALISVAQSGENAISLVAGANGALSPSDVSAHEASLARAAALLLQLETPIETSLAAARLVRRAGGIVILDPAPAPASGLGDEVLRAVDIITPNETEAAALLGTAPTTLAEGEEAARALLARGVKTAVVKLGAKGLAYATAGGSGTVPAFRVTAIDTVAAGDCFNGGLAHGLASGMALEPALRFAAAAAALSTTRRGAAVAAPTLAEVAAFLKTATPV